MSTPPVKPPRGIKPTKETSGLLISVLRALSASETNEQREVEKAKLEKEYKKSDQKLDELVSIHDQDLNEVMQIFSNLSERVTTAREKIHGVKENLHACKQLLGCRRDELMKLWLEGIEHKHILDLLTEIDQMKNVPSKLSYYLNKKLYLHATQLLVSALSMGDGNLNGVEALREVRIDLKTKKQQLQSKLLDELNRHLYVETTRDVLLKRQDSGRDFQRGNETRGSRGNKVKRSLLDTSFSNIQSLKNNNESDDITNIVEDENSLNPEENSDHFIAIIIQCFALLNYIPDAVDAIKVQMQQQLNNIIAKTSEQIKQNSVKSNSNQVKPVIIINNINDINNDENDDDLENQSLLIELLQSLFEQFRSVVRAHTSALRSLSQICKKYNLYVRLYEIADVWSVIQAVLQTLLTDYLDIQNMVDRPFQSSALTETSSNINTYFSRRKIQRPKMGNLFKFEFTSHPKTLNNYIKDNNKTNIFYLNDNNLTKKYLVCEPDAKNIKFIFRPMMAFIDEIERALDYKNSGTLCTLNSFIADFVKEVFLGRHHVIVATIIDTATKGSDAWKGVTSPELTKELGLSRPLLQSTVKVEQCFAELRSLMIALPLQGEHFCTLALNILHNYRETCHTAYRQIIHSDSEEKKICSATWLKDDDISRFIKSLPNWDNMKKESYIIKKRGKAGRRTIQQQETQEEENPEDIRQRNLREAEMLASNLGEGGISSNEILSDVGQLRSLALLHESIEWFALSVRLLTAELHEAKNNEQSLLPKISDSLIELLEQVIVEFEELANTCILLLHLEARVQCFHYLLPRGEYIHLCGGKDSHEVHPRVEEFSKVLQNIDEALQSMLHPKKTKYIFEGLGHLIAKILITSVQYIDKIDKNGIQKMCRNVFTLQQTLTNITMTRELALDYARQYFELFYLTPDEILNDAIENGLRFSDPEYINALQLIARSQPQYSQIQKYLEKLSEIRGEIGVTV